DGSGRVIASSDTDIYKSVGFSWSPDSSKLAYGRHWSTSDGRVHFGTYVYDLATTESTRITGDMDALDPAWSPSGEDIAIVVFERDTGASRLALIKPDGSDLRILTDGDGMPDNVFRPCWSPDGREICMEVVHWGQVNLATIGVEPGGPGLRMLIDEEDGYNRSPDWSPDGGSIAFYRYEAGVPQVFVYDLGAETLARITGENIRSMYDPSYAPDGTLVSPAWGSRYSDVRLMEPDPLAEPEPMPRPGPDYKPLYTTAETIGERYPEVDTSSWERRSYSSWNAIRIFLFRPNIISDPYGSQPAVRLFAQDPLEQHTIAAELSYSRQTGEPGYSIEYVNSENRGNYFARARRRLGGPKRVGVNQSVFDAELAYVAGARWMRNPIPSTYTRDNYGVSLVHQRFDVVDSLGGAVAPDQSTTYLEATWERFSATPTNVSYTIRLTGRASVPQLSRRSQLYDARAELEWSRTWSGTRRELSVGLDARTASFSNRLGAGISGSYLLPSVAYRWRLEDYAWSSAWPFVWLDMVDLTVGADYYVSFGNSLLQRPAGLALRAELAGRGHITHGLPYELALGAEYRPQAAAGNRARVTLTFTTDAESVFPF
ncbi:MAG: hypothetical protein GF320_12295, partial [Armatimonadia bacterium]|nr:hypothetical protein [Armatimonadia bacterium]